MCKEKATDLYALSSTRKIQTINPTLVIGITMLKVRIPHNIIFT